MSLSTVVRLSVVWSLVFAAAAEGQEPQRLAPGGCDACSIRLDPLLEIGYGAGEFGGVTSGYLVKDSRGRFYHTSLYTPWAVLVFDSSGVFLKAIGREGDGPGEFRNIYRAAIGPNDSLYVYDQSRRDITVLDSDYRYARKIPIGQHVSQMSIGPSGSILVNGDFRTRSGFAYPFHHLDSSGAIRSFGSERLGDRTGRINRLVLRQPFARADSDTFWAVDATTYVLERWTLDGRLLARAPRAPVAWFRHHDPSTLEGRTNPLVYDIHVAPDGLLWVVVKVRDANWREMATLGPEGAPGRRGLMSSTGDLLDLHDGMIEVIDPVRTTVLASLRTEHVIWGFVGDAIYVYEKDEFDIGRWVLYRPVLVR